MENPRTSNLETAGSRAWSSDLSGTVGNTSGVSWPAVWAGGFVTAALSLILLALGTGLGFASMSVWSGAGVSTAKIGAAAIVWFIIVQIISSSMGGYLAGRLRTKWTGIHGDEVYFRDTAHGFLAWSVALVMTAAFLSSAATSLIGSTADSAHSAGSSTHGEMAPNAYFVDSLFRGDAAKPEAMGPASHQASDEAATIFAFALEHGVLSNEDKTYLDQMVAARTGLSQTDADKRVSDAFTGAQSKAVATRKAIAYTLLWSFIALLMGAFCASFAGTIGGRQRDHVVAI